MTTVYKMKLFNNKIIGSILFTLQQHLDLIFGEVLGGNIWTFSNEPVNCQKFGFAQNIDSCPTGFIPVTDEAECASVTTAMGARSWFLYARKWCSAMNAWLTDRVGFNASWPGFTYDASYESTYKAWFPVQVRHVDRKHHFRDWKDRLRSINFEVKNLFGQTHNPPALDFALETLIMVGCGQSKVHK